MLSTSVAFGVFFTLFVAGFILWLALLAVGLRWAKVPGVTIGRLIVATALVSVVGGLLTGLISLRWVVSNLPDAVLAILSLVLSVLANVAIIASVFHTRFVRALQAWLPTLIASLVMGLAALLVRAIAFEAFVSPTNAMAPTLLGKHLKAPCAICGQPAVRSAHALQGPSSEPPPMICPSFHVSHPTEVTDQLFSPDRFIVAKFLAPRRWDLVVFETPFEPKTLYVKRLVGFPGETIHIDEGSVWVDGKKLPLPESLKGLEYVPSVPDSLVETSGTKENPALLGDDESFVLGDFSVSSFDSRFWPEGEPGHHRYAVPKSNIRGVVTHIYWPPSRVRVVR